jgi:hypothetical protein
MPYLLANSNEFSASELAVMKRAFEEALSGLGGAGRPAVERETACAIIGAAQCGCFDHVQLVTIGTAAGGAADAASRNRVASNGNAQAGGA